MMDGFVRRLIEVDLPIKVISARARHDQNVHNNPVSSTSEMVPKDTWQHYEKNLLSGDISPRPIYLVELEIASSGHSYETLVEKVQLVGA